MRREVINLSMHQMLGYALYYAGSPIEVGCFEGDLGYTDIWSVDLIVQTADGYQTDAFSINRCRKSCAYRPFVGIVSSIV